MVVIQAQGTQRTPDPPGHKAFSSLVVVKATSASHAKLRVRSKLQEMETVKIKVFKAGTIRASTVLRSGPESARSALHIAQKGGVGFEAFDPLFAPLC
jgi:hypothetical protein